MRIVFIYTILPTVGFRINFSILVIKLLVITLINAISVILFIKKINENITENFQQMNHSF